MLLPDQFIDNQLATPESVLCSVKFERFEAVFTGAGDTLSGALAALIASGSALPEAATEALTYLDRSLNGGFRPGMGQVIPDRLFWANSDDDDDEDADDGEETLDDGDLASQSLLDLPAPDTKH
jgi:hydroxymethylpyrimidine/phosphomethylpyrimidine kinase